MSSGAEPRSGLLGHRWVVVAALLAAIAVVQLATIEPGHGWLDDFAAYIEHAENLAEGTPYADTGYIYSDLNPNVAPRAYPPVYPLLLVPVIEVFGADDLLAMKVEMVVFFLLWLFVLDRLLEPRIGSLRTLIVVGAVGFSPFFTEMKNNILSDIPFALFATLALLVADRAARADARGWSAARRGGIVGACIALATATRSVGLVLVPVVVAHDVFRRRLGVGTAATVAKAGILLAVQTAIIPAGGGYLDILPFFSARTAVVNLWRYTTSVEGLTVNGFWTLGGRLLMFLLLAMAAAGFVRSLAARRWRPDVVHLFVPAYVVALAAWPSFQSLRFLLPVVPFVFAYALEAVDFDRRRAPAMALAGLLAVAYIGVFARLAIDDPPRDGVHTANAQALFATIAATPPDTVVIAPRPKAIPWATGRRGAAYPLVLSAASLGEQIARTGADLLVDWRQEGFQLSDEIRANGGRLVYENADFRVFRVG